MIYKTIASFKYRGQTISVREERVITISTPSYLVYKNRRMYSSWRYKSKQDALERMLSVIHEFCRI